MQSEVRPRRSLGQNFVVDPNTVRRIVRLAGVKEGDLVVEVGAGLGSLTLALCEAGARVKAIEVDKRLLPLLRSQLAGTSAEVIEADALKIDWGDLLADEKLTKVPDICEVSDANDYRSEEDVGLRSLPRYSLVANLPYNIATSVAIGALENAKRVNSMLIMVQREVGERMVAQPRSRAFGAVSVKVAYWAKASLVGRVPPTVFYPRPNVESVLVQMVRRPEVLSASTDMEYRRFCEVVKAGFAQRRKTLRSSLKEVVDPRAFERTGIYSGARAEELNVDEWKRLGEVLQT